PPNSHLSLFFSKSTPPPQIYTLSLHDALPISVQPPADLHHRRHIGVDQLERRPDRLGPFDEQPHRLALGCHRTSDGLPSVGEREDRKSTRLNSSHVAISYAVFCLKKKNKRRH